MSAEFFLRNNSGNRFISAESEPASCAIGHISPEAALGGAIALFEPDDRVEFDLPARRISLLVDDEILGMHRVAWKSPAPKITSGYLARYASMITSAEQGTVLKVPV